MGMKNEPLSFTNPSLSSPEGKAAFKSCGEAEKPFLRKQHRREQLDLQMHTNTGLWMTGNSGMVR